MQLNYRNLGTIEWSYECFAFLRRIDSSALPDVSKRRSAFNFEPGNFHLARFLTYKIQIIYFLKRSQYRCMKVSVSPRTFLFIACSFIQIIYFLKRSQYRCMKVSVSPRTFLFIACSFIQIIYFLKRSQYRCMKVSVSPPTFLFIACSFIHANIAYFNTYRFDMSL